MAIEPTETECWREWKNSGKVELENLADELFPHLSVREEFMRALNNGDDDKALYIGNVIKKYCGPKDTFRDQESALKALYEIRSYQN